MSRSTAPTKIPDLRSGSPNVRRSSESSRTASSSVLLAPPVCGSGGGTEPASPNNPSSRVPRYPFPDIAVLNINIMSVKLSHLQPCGRRGAKQWVARSEPSAALSASNPLPKAILLCTSQAKSPPPLPSPPPPHLIPTSKLSSKKMEENPHQWILEGGRTMIEDGVHRQA